MSAHDCVETIDGWWEVYGVVAGAAADTTELDDETEADEAARKLADEYRKLGDTVDQWAVYILPHYCDRNEEASCECATWLTDHRPIYERTAA